MLLILALGPAGEGRAEAAGPAMAVRAGGPQATGMAELEQMALRSNPTVAQAFERLQQDRGRAAQAGLYPNPLLAYDSGGLGAEGTPGTHGAFLQQPIVTGGKIRVNQSRYEVDVEIGRWEVLEQRYRVVNGVRLRYFQILALQRLLGLREQAVRVADEVARTVRAKVETDHASEADLATAETEAARARRAERTLRERYVENWREMAAFIGCPELEPTPLAGNLEQGLAPFEWGPTLAHLLEASPLVRIALLRIKRQQLTLRREQLEPIPDLILRGGADYDHTLNQAIGLARVYVEFPIWNRNQGNIATAQHGLTDVRRDLDRARLDIQQALARTFTRYNNSRTAAASLRDEILPKARRAFELYLESFREEDASYSRVQSSLSAYIEAHVEYIEELLEWRRSEAAIVGLLIVEERIGAGSLRPTPEGLEAAPSGGGAPAGRPARTENP